MGGDYAWLTYTLREPLEKELCCHVHKTAGITKRQSWAEDLPLGWQLRFETQMKLFLKKFQAIYWRPTKIYSVKGRHSKVSLFITLFNFWNIAGGRKGCVRLWHKVEKCTHLCSAVVSLSLIHPYTSHHRFSMLCWFQGLDFKWVLFVPWASGRCTYKISVCFASETDVETGV